MVVAASCATAGGGPEDTGSTSDADGGGLDTDVPPECADLRVGTDLFRPVDIVAVVDSSPSMEDEAAQVQRNLNLFAARILEVGIDPRVVLITDRDFVNVPPPLGVDRDHYLFIHSDVGSRSPLIRLLDEWPHYASFLREEALTHFIGITDDESAITADQFDDEISGKLGKPYTFHAIASDGDVCPSGMAEGRRYFTLANRTGGLQLSICTADWTAIFDSLRDHITAMAPLPCNFALPDPPADSVLDYSRGQLDYLDAAGLPHAVPRVLSAGACSGQGWHYDNARSPAAIVLCPDSCDTVTLLGGRVEISFDCDAAVN